MERSSAGQSHCERWSRHAYLRLDEEKSHTLQRVRTACHVVALPDLAAPEKSRSRTARAGGISGGVQGLAGR